MGRGKYVHVIMLFLAIAAPPAVAKTSASPSPILSHQDYDRLVAQKKPLWREQLRRQCETGKPGVTIQAFDADGQPGNERICSRVIHDPTLGAYLEVVAVAKRAAGRTQTAHILMAADDWMHPEQPSPDGGQPLLCDPRNAQLSRYIWNAKDDHMFELGNHRPVAIKVTTGKCDASYLFWPRDLDTPEVEFELETDSPG